MGVYVWLLFSFLGSGGWLGCFGGLGWCFLFWVLGGGLAVLVVWDGVFFFVTASGNEW
jgi:hypothetical protein